MSLFQLHKPYQSAGDQPKAIRELTRFLEAGATHQTLLGVTGSGKTFTMANIIANLDRPALIISHNKTLASQLYQEFKTFFPENAVHYFVSYYDYYQPEAYIPQTDTYIEKDAKINDFIDSMRHAATASALTRRDLIIVASVSCIYGLGDPVEYKKAAIIIDPGTKISQRAFLKHLVEIQYERNDVERRAGVFRVRGEAVELIAPSGNNIVRIEWDGNVIDRITIEPLRIVADTLQHRKILSSYQVFPGKHFVMPQDKLGAALQNIEEELEARLAELRNNNKILEAERLKQRTRFDLATLRETGFVHGIENYSRQLSFRKPGEPGATLLDYLPQDFLLFVDESHMTMPQIRGMYAGDRARKETLIEYGFRLPSAIDNRPLMFDEFVKKIGQTVYVSATPAEYEMELSKEHIAEQIIRPTGLLDPQVEVRSASDNQMKDVLSEIEKRIEKKERILVTTLTKRMAEDLAQFLKDENIKTEYIHSDIKTMERTKILMDLRKGTYDVIVGINLLREGIDLPEVSLVIILDADKEGFLRNASTLIQTIGRAARHTSGTVIMYADRTTKSMQFAIDETNRRRAIQAAYNTEHNIKPQSITREINETLFGIEMKKPKINITELTKKISKEKLIEELTKEMYEVAQELDFERAAELRDAIKELEEK